ncbi:MAG: hypothetical protein P4L43_08165 [Syntrophobacteraceae bacterium]|nr:hypothetical protein [Syntrophobacteraceae bacterium]
MISSRARLSTIFLSMALLLAVATGCVQTPFPGAKPSGPVFAPPSASAEIAAMKERSDFWRDFESKLRIEVNGKNASFSSRAIVLVGAPDLIRFETFTPIGMTAALFVSAPTGPFLLIPSQNTIFTASRPETLARRFLGEGVPVDLFCHLLTASLPPKLLPNIQSRAEGPMLRLISKGPGGYLEWQIVSGALTRMFIGSARFEGQVSYDPPVRLAGESTPQTIRIASKGWSMVVRVEQMRTAREFNPSVFRLPVLPGMRRVDLDREK